MLIPNGTVIAVANGENLNLYRNSGTEAEVKLVVVDDDNVEPAPTGHTGREGSSANPDGGQDKEDEFSRGAVDLLNERVLSGKVSSLIVIAASRALGKMRQNYHKKTTEALVGEIDKDLTGHPVAEIEKAIAAA